MPPVRKKDGQKVNRVTLYSFTVTGHKFLGPGTDLERLKYLPPLNKLDAAAKKHDFLYNNPKVSIAESDEQFYKDTEGTGILGTLARGAIKTKHILGLDSVFRGNPTDVGADGYQLLDTNQIMADSADSSNQNSDGGQGNGWQGRNIGGYLPMGLGNHAKTYIFRQSFKNIVNLQT